MYAPREILKSKEKDKVIIILYSMILSNRKGIAFLNAPGLRFLVRLTAIILRLRGRGITGVITMRKKTTLFEEKNVPALVFLPLIWDRNWIFAVSGQRLETQIYHHCI